MILKGKKISVDPTTFTPNSFPMDELMDCENDLFQYFLTEESSWFDSSSEMSPPSSSQSPLFQYTENNPSSSTIISPPSLIETRENMHPVKQEVELPKLLNHPQDLKHNINRSLTPEEERQLKRQKRLIKNRESAQLSRLRKKIYIEELEKKVTSLAAQNELLTQQVNSISADKKKLSEEVLYLQNIVKSSSHLPHSESSSLVPVKRNPSNLKAAGVCLLMVLFSFGLIFNAAQQQNNQNNQNGLNWTSLNRREEIAETPSKELFTNPLPSVQIPPIVEKKEIKKTTSTKRSREQVGLIEEISSPMVGSEISETPILKSLANTKVQEIPAPKRRKLDQRIMNLKKGIPSVTPSIERQSASVPPTVSSSVSSPDMVALLVPSQMVNPSLFLVQDFSPPLQVFRQLLNLYIWPMAYSN